jgi:DNA adenine methylase
MVAPALQTMISSQRQKMRCSLSFPSAQSDKEIKEEGVMAAVAVLQVQVVPVRPPLKWAGGKRWLVRHLAELRRAHERRRLVEPFCGGLAVALSLRPKRALLNDINPHAVHFYSWLKRGLRVNEELEFANREELYYEHRTRFNELISDGKADSAEAAALFYYLNRTCYNGLCRFNSSGLFNVPFGRYKRINYIRDFTTYRHIFCDWQFSIGDFEQLSVETEDFVYADPPYDVEFRSYSKEGFSWDDQVRLAEWLAKHQGPMVLSNQATDRILRLYERLGFRLRMVDAPRMINCTGDRSPVKEVLATRGLD